MSKQDITSLDLFIRSNTERINCSFEARLIILLVGCFGPVDLERARHYAAPTHTHLLRPHRCENELSI